MSFWKKSQAVPGDSHGTESSERPPLVTPLNGAKPLAMADRVLSKRVAAPPPIPGEAPALPDSAQQAAPPQAAPPRLTDEQLRQAAEAAKGAAAAFGEIVSVMARAPGYRDLPLHELLVRVIPAIATGQFSIAEAQSNVTGVVAPVGVVMWASVSDEIDKRLSATPDQTVRLELKEWVSGDILWLVDAMGERKAVEAMLKRLAETQWKGRRIKVPKSGAGA